MKRSIPKIIQKLVFGCVGYTAHFLSSLAACARTIVARSRQNFQLLSHFRYIFFVFAVMSAPLAIFAELKVLAFAGSTRADSYNKKLMLEAVEKAKEMGAQVTVIDLKDYPIPLYDADLEARDGMPEPAKKLRQIMLEHDAMIIASPEYNASMPAVLKNALDWSSRTEDCKFSKAAFKDKKFAIMSATPGRRGGVRALSHLRLVLEDLGGIVVQPQVEVPKVHEFTLEKEERKMAVLKEELQALLSENFSVEE